MRDAVAKSASLFFALTLSSVSASACKTEITNIGGTSGASTSTSTDAVADAASDSPLACMPGQTRCSGETILEICGADGVEWTQELCPNEAPCIVCEPGDSCDRDHCKGCETDVAVPSSAGCSFVTTRQLGLQPDAPDAVLVVNPAAQLDASVTLWRTPVGTNAEELVEEVTLAPGEDHVFVLASDFTLDDASVLRRGGTWRVDTETKIVASQHGGGDGRSRGESALLLPERMADKTYVIGSYSPHAEALPDGGRPSYFEVVALQDETTVQWTPPVATAGDGAPVQAVGPGETGSVQMNRFDTLRIAASADLPDDVCDDLQDMSGTVVLADKPVRVTAGSRCSRVPVRGYVRDGDDTDTGCDWDSFPRRGVCAPLQEQLVPVRHWGRTYVAPHAPFRDPLGPLGLPVENHWRLYNGRDATNTITSLPAVFTADNCPPPNLVSMDGTQCTLPKRGAWVEVETAGDVNVRFDAEWGATLMVVGYLQSPWKGCELDPTPYDDPAVCVDEPLEEATSDGNPAMYQLLPRADFSDRYVLSTGEGYAHHFVQIIRNVGGAEVRVDDIPVSANAFEPVDDELEVATVEIGEGTHTLDSSERFGALQLGYAGSSTGGNAAYAHPAGVSSDMTLDSSD